MVPRLNWRILWIVGNKDWLDSVNLAKFRVIAYQSTFKHFLDSIRIKFKIIVDIVSKFLQQRKLWRVAKLTKTEVVN